MTTYTQVVWTAETNAEIHPVVTAELVILVNDGKTDGSCEVTVVAGGTAYVRPWYTVQDAEDWLTFINALEVPPVSAEILP